LRILIVDTCYPAFLADHYAQRVTLAHAPYAEQWDALMATGFGTSDSYSYYLGRLGHQAHELVANCKPLQTAWAREHAIRPRASRFPRLRAEEVLVLAQADAFEPDVVYCQDLTFLSQKALQILRKRGALVVGQIATEVWGTKVFHSFDLLLSSFPHYVDAFRRRGLAAEYFPIAFDERALERLANESSDQNGVVFVGALARGPRWPGNEMFERVAARVPVDFWGYNATGWEPNSPLLRRYRGEAWGTEMFRVLRQARIALNRHGQVAAGYANNMRLFEATGVGTLLVTEAAPNLDDLFEAEREVVTYSSEEELVARIRYYLEHEDERQKVAAAGQRRTLRDHTYAHRMEQLVGLLERARGEA
jgi:spore maturation protein CgeB